MVLPALNSLYHDIDQDKLRVQRPSKLIFLCGGAISKIKIPRPISLRDYIKRVKNIDKNLSARVVLAEAATQLYSSTTYGDLISFEEDIARIASAVVVIVESPGAFAELGAFATSATISRNLLLIIKQDHSETESFITLGPVRRIKLIKRTLVGEFPWKTDGSGAVVQSSASPHYNSLVKFINDYVDSQNKSESFEKIKDSFQFFIFYWIIYIAHAVSFEKLFEYTKIIIPNIDKELLSNKLYCMIIASWIKKVPYAGVDYFFVLHDHDPFHYAFKVGVIDTDSIRRKFTVKRAMKALETPPASITSAATAARRSA